MKLDESCISNPKSEISDWTRGKARSNLRFRISDLRCRIRPISNFVSFFLLVLGASSLFSAADEFPSFVDVAGRVGVTLMNVAGGASKDYIIEANGNGAAFFDYDNDGDMDILIANGSTLDNYKKGGDPMIALYKNNGGTFADVTREAGLVKRGWGIGVCAGDYNNDGFQDFYLTAYGPNVLFRNNGNGVFSDVTASAGVNDTHWSTNCAFGDYDRDGRLDLYVANYMTFDENDRAATR